ncbi:hypothetical protein KQ876_01685 [Mycoplasma sp. CSL7491-lung]|uniref:hypothetical protein n=1 Tax=Mycoplasma sp. CSL7491-lung TaxID=549718 RepID=UPI001C1074A2|nr:hypothetical protein [Mycoplasma sp. CSL7491-lung]MBU4692917.1 hypothetical protein [Mycoplasma sp. CSL7491-lung]
MKQHKTLVIHFGKESIQIVNHLIKINSLIKEFEYIAIDSDFETLNNTKLENKILINNWKSDQFINYLHLEPFIIGSDTIFLLVNLNAANLLVVKEFVSLLSSLNKKVNLISFYNHSDFDQIKKHFFNEMCSIYLINNENYQEQLEFFNEEDILKLKSIIVNDYLKFYYHMHNNNYIEDKENIFNKFNNSNKINIITAWAFGSRRVTKILDKLLKYKDSFFDNLNQAIVVIEHSSDFTLDELYILKENLKSKFNLEPKLILVKNNDTKIKLTIFMNAEYKNINEQKDILDEPMQFIEEISYNLTDANGFEEDDFIINYDDNEEKEQIIIDYNDTSDIEF